MVPEVLATLLLASPTGLLLLSGDADDVAHRAVGGVESADRQEAGAAGRDSRELDRGGHAPDHSRRKPD